jgi:hypothetical protein
MRDVRKQWADGRKQMEFQAAEHNVEVYNVTVLGEDVVGYQRAVVESWFGLVYVLKRISC